jgi:hypothetical protein
MTGVNGLLIMRRKQMLDEEKVFKRLCRDMHIGNDHSKVEDARIIWEAAIAWKVQYDESVTAAREEALSRYE